MLDRLVGTVNVLAGVAEQNTREMSQLKSSVEQLVSIAELHQQSLDMHHQNFNAVISEIREIQA
jgi:hypothetical protein